MRLRGDLAYVCVSAWPPATSRSPDSPLVGNLTGQLTPALASAGLTRVTRRA